MTKRDDLRVPLLAGTGGMLEFYDFILYILFLPQISQAFFQNIESVYIQDLIGIAVFSIAYIIRPLGGFFVGWLGDNIGRKKSFSFTILLMGICVFLMGVMPTYQQIGLAAPLLFVFLRIVQGFALGGELPGAMVFVYESVRQKGFALGIMFAMVFCGFLLGDLMHVVFETLFHPYGWRAAFISGSLVAFLGFYIRQRLEETALFRSLKHKEKFPLRVLIKKQNVNLLGAISSVIVVAFAGVFVELLLPKYMLDHLNYQEHFISNVSIFISIIGIAIIFLTGYMSDYIPYRGLYKLFSLFLMLIAFPAFFLLSSGYTVWITLGAFLIMLAPAGISGLFIRIICDEFSTDVRFSGVAIAYNLAFALVGGVVPLLTELLIHHVGVVTGPSLITIGCAMIGLISMFLFRVALKLKQK
jgi:MFS family permease